MLDDIIKQFQSAWETVHFLSNPTEKLDYLARRHGDTIFLNPKAVIFANPNAVQTIFAASSDQLGYRQNSTLIKMLLGSCSFILLPENEHQFQRRLIQPYFYKESLENCGQSIVAATKRTMSQFNSGKPFAVRSAMKEISIQVLAQAVFGLELQSHRHKEFCQIVIELFNLFESPLFQIYSLAAVKEEEMRLSLTDSLEFSRFPFLNMLSFPPLFQQKFLPWGIFQELQQKLDKLIYTEIAERRKAKHTTNLDIFSVLLATKDETERTLSDSEIHDALMTLIYAGFETAAAALTWALYWIHYVPNVQKELAKEISLQNNVNPMFLARLPYLNAVCNETLRISPATDSIFTRTVKQPIEIDGHYLEPGTSLAVSIYLAHRREVVYPEPNKFMPERFLERQYSPYEFLPFGGGPCRCLGASLAQYEMKLVIATIVKQFRLELIDPKPIRSKKHGVTMIPSEVVEMRITQSL